MGRFFFQYRAGSGWVFEKKSRVAGGFASGSSVVSFDQVYIPEIPDIPVSHGKHCTNTCNVYSCTLFRF